MAIAQSMPDQIQIGVNFWGFPIYGPNPNKAAAIARARAMQQAAELAIQQAKAEIAEGEAEKAAGEELKRQGEQEKTEGEQKIAEGTRKIEEGQKEKEAADLEIKEWERQKKQAEAEKDAAETERDTAKVEAQAAKNTRNKAEGTINELQAAIEAARAEEARQTSQGGNSGGGTGGGTGGGGIGGGGSGAGTGGGIGNGMSFVMAARGILIAIGRISASMSNNSNPIFQIAKNLTNKGLTEQAIAYLEAALVDSALQGTPTNQAIILFKAMASTIHGEAETNIAFWKEVINENKQLGKQTHDVAKMA